MVSLGMDNPLLVILG